jgi:hypothetical protein
MLANNSFRYLQRIWNPHRDLQPKSVGPFYLAEWVAQLNHLKREFEEELETHLINLDERGGLRYLHSLARQLDAILEPIASLPTAAPTNLLALVEKEQIFVHTSFYKQVKRALAARGKGAATPVYDDEEVALPFQNECIQDNFLAVLRFVKEQLASLEVTPAQSGQGRRTAKETLPPYIWKSGLNRLLDLLLTLEEKHHMRKRNDDESPQNLAKAVTALFQLPESATASELEDWQRFRQYVATKDPDDSKIYSKRAKKRYFDGIEPYSGK